MAPPRASPLLSHSARALRTQCGWLWMLGGDTWHGSACCLLLLGTCLLLVSQISCDRTCTGQEAFLQMPTRVLFGRNGYTLNRDTVAGMPALQCDPAFPQQKPAACSSYSANIGQSNLQYLHIRIFQENPCRWKMAGLVCCSWDYEVGEASYTTSRIA
eukprot:s4077_g5.t1